MKNLIISFLFSSCVWCIWSQNFSPDFTLSYSSNKNVHARALAVKNGDVFVGTNTGELYKVLANTNEIVSFEQKSFKEFRDIIVLPESVIILSSGDTSAILQYSLKDTEIKRVQMFNGIFLDGFDKNQDSIVVIGDPLDGEFTSFSASLSTLDFHPIQSAKSFPKEASYAASGSTVLEQNGLFYFFSGGMKNRMFVIQDSL
ncbi:MAG: hypothetical protein KJ941_09880, partial [Bacteroidetes bacterium]|nr:hypothetical protein [Bacteroidota bacterium]